MRALASLVGPNTGEEARDQIQAWAKRCATALKKGRGSRSKAGPILLERARLGRACASVTVNRERRGELPVADGRGMKEEGTCVSGPEMAERSRGESHIPRELTWRAESTTWGEKGR